MNRIFNIIINFFCKSDNVRISNNELDKMNCNNKYKKHYIKRLSNILLITILLFINIVLLIIDIIKKHQSNISNNEKKYLFVIFLINFLSCLITTILYTFASYLYNIVKKSQILCFIAYLIYLLIPYIVLLIPYYDIIDKDNLSNKSNLYELFNSSSISEYFNTLDFVIKNLLFLFIKVFIFPYGLLNASIKFKNTFNHKNTKLLTLTLILLNGAVLLFIYCIIVNVYVLVYHFLNIITSIYSNNNFENIFFIIKIGFISLNILLFFIVLGIIFKYFNYNWISNICMFFIIIIILVGDYYINFITSERVFLIIFNIMLSSQSLLDFLDIIVDKKDEEIINDIEMNLLDKN
jgi:hypothetical protein